MQQLPFQFHQELETIYPGESVEVTFSGSVFISNDEDENDFIVDVSMDGKELDPIRPEGVSVKDWKRFETRCIEAAIDAEYMEFCKEQCELTPKQL